jgi:hypothetical protein
LVVLAGVIVGAAIYVENRDTSDGQYALVWPFLILWTLLALFVVWVLDRLFGGRRR